jgi:hypothetical protein
MELSPNRLYFRTQRKLKLFLSEHNEIKLKIYSKRNCIKYSKHMETEQHIVA